MTTIDGLMLRLDADASALRAELGAARVAVAQDATRMGEAFQDSAGAIEGAFSGTFGRLRHQVATMDLDVRGLLRGLLSDLAFGFADLGLDSVFGLAASVALPAFAGAAPRAQPAAGGNPVNVTVTQSFALGVAPTVRAELAAMMPTIRRDVTAAVVEAQRRSGGRLI